VKFIVDGNQPGLTGQGAVSATVPIRRPYLLRAFDMPAAGGEPRPCDIIYERRVDAPESQKNNSAAMPGTKGNFSCTNIVNTGYGDRGNEECGGFCFWGTYKCQHCHMSVRYHYEMLGINVQPGGEDYDAPLSYDAFLEKVNEAAKAARAALQPVEEDADVEMRPPTEGDLAVVPGVASSFE
jgi:hypothetical protein